MKIFHRMLTYICCLVVWVAVSGSAQERTDEPVQLLDRLAGDWVLTGALGKSTSTHDVHGEWVLNHEYMRLHEVSREKKANGDPVYEAIILISWDPKAQEYACLWLDNTEGGGLSAQSIAHARRQGLEIPFVWSQAGEESLRNTFTYNPALDTWKWIIDNITKGKADRFADVTLTRVRNK